MRKFLKLWIVCATLFASSTGVLASDEDAVRDRMQAWLGAFNAKDADQLATLYSDKVYYANNGSKLALNARDIIENYRAQFTVAPDVTIDFKEELVAAGPRFGHIAGQYRVNIPQEDGSLQQAFGRVLLVFERINNKWLLVVDFDNQGSDLNAQSF